MSSRIIFLRSKEVGCRWAATLASSEEAKRLFERIADQYRDVADELELLNKLWPPTANLVASNGGASAEGDKSAD